MKIYIDREPVTGPWGGGNKTVIELCTQLKDKGHEVVHRLSNDDIDLIFCFDPRPNSAHEWYQNFLDYKFTHNVPIVQRVGDCGTHGKPELTKLVKQAVSFSDVVIFPSEWAKKQIGCDDSRSRIIHNAPLDIFHRSKKKSKLNRDKIRIITHHWSTNPKKGFSYYRKLDEHLQSNTDISFTYVGRWPDEPHLQNSEYIPATGDNDFISEKISECDIYLTASEEEAGANHVLEAVACGLPVVYHSNGGSIPEYCNRYGLEFNNFDKMLASIEAVRQNYDFYKRNALGYQDNVSKAVERYIKIICNTK